MFVCLCAAFARLYYHSPKYVIMDESTSALDIDLEAQCMRNCIARGITMLSVGHRPTLLQYHQQLLELDGHGGYAIRELPAVELPPLSATKVKVQAPLSAATHLEVARGGSNEEVAEVKLDFDGVVSRFGGGKRRSKGGKSNSIDHGSGGLAVSTDDLFDDGAYVEEQDNPWEAAMFKDTTAIDATVKIDRVFFRRLWRLFRAGQ